MSPLMAAVGLALSIAFAGRIAVVIAGVVSLFPDAYACMKRIGEVLVDGDHDALLARGGKYAELYNSQFG